MTNLRIYSGLEDAQPSSHELVADAAAPLPKGKNPNDASLGVVWPMVCAAFAIAGLVYNQPIKRWVSQAVNSVPSQAVVRDGQAKTKPSRPIIETVEAPAPNNY